MTAPCWSVVVPTYNRPQRLAACIASLVRLRPPAGGYEIIVVNDGGVEPDVGTRAAAAAGHALAARFLTRVNGGPGAARNTGVAAAAGRWIAFTDDDCEPAADWLRGLERALGDAPDALAGGAVVNALEENLLSAASQTLVSFVAEWFASAGNERFFTSNNMALSRQGFVDAGGFCEVFGTAAGEDREFCDRWFTQGRATVVADAVVRHAHALSARSFLRQHYAYGRGASIFRSMRREAARPVRIEPAFYLESLRHAGRGRPSARGLALVVLTGVAHAAYAAGLARETLRPGPRTVPPAPRA
jgi:glycosyltransferase involved in cell wall biosynthesis